MRLRIRFKTSIVHMVCRLLFLIHRDRIRKDLVRSGLTRFGSSYGGWFLPNLALKPGAILISAGVGEDISFDIEFLNETNGTVVLIDPVKRAKQYLDLVLERLGDVKSTPYSRHGFQPVTSYSLKNIARDDIVFLNQALSDTNGTIYLNPPADRRNVSYTYTDELTLEAIRFESVSMDNIIRNYVGSKPYILKLDIEGAEIKVLRHLLTLKNLPCFIAVELDSLRDLKFSNIKLVNETFIYLKHYGFKLVKLDSGRNFSFIRDR